MEQHRDAPPVVVVGLSCWYPDARNPSQFWENILSRRRAFRRTPDRRLPMKDYHDPDPGQDNVTYGRRMAVIDGFDFDWRQRRIPQKTAASTDIVHWLALETALAAVTDAGYNVSSIARRRTGVLVGNTLTGEQTRSTAIGLRWPFVRRLLRAATAQCRLDAEQHRCLEEAMAARFKAIFQPMNEDSLAGGLSNTIAGRICHYLDLDGGGYTVDGACSSSLLAAANALERLTHGELDLVLVGGVDISLDPFELVGFAKTGALSSGDMHVYDSRSAGFIPGEGCGFMLLKRESDARRDGDYLYAHLHGWGISSDGKGAGITAPTVTGQVKAMARAFKRTPFGPSELDFIEGHGTGTIVGDRAELAAIARILTNDPASRLRGCGLTSLKSIIGHTKAASGIGGLIKAVLAVNRRVIPPMAGCARPHPIFQEEAKVLFPVLRGQIRDPGDTLKAGVSSMGFGGINCHITLSSADPPRKALSPVLAEQALLASHQQTEVFVFSAQDKHALIDQLLSMAKTVLDISQAEMTDLAAHLARQAHPRAGARAAMVAHDPESLADGLRLAAARLAGEKNRRRADSVWHHSEPVEHEPRIGMLFPGQDGRHINMARVLVERFEWAGRMLDAAESHVGLIEGRPLRWWMFKNSEQALSQDDQDQWRDDLARPQIAQPAVCLASALWLTFMRNLGVEPAAVGGRGLGELTAFYAAGALDFDTLMRFAVIRARIMARATEGEGAMAALRCGCKQAEALIAPLADKVAAATIDSSCQTVLSGDQESIENLLQAAREQGIAGRLLKTTGAFQGHLMPAAALTLGRQASFPPTAIENISCRLFGAGDGRELKKGDAAAAYLRSRINAPVRFADLMAAMADCADLFVEVGPGEELSRLVADTVSGGALICLPVASREDADQDLNAVLAALFVHGVEVNWKALYERRMVRPFIAPQDKRFIENICETPLSDADFPAVAKPSPPAAADHPLAVLAGVSTHQWSEYLDRRAGFLAKVVMADMETAPLVKDRPPAVEPGRASDTAETPRTGPSDEEKKNPKTLLLDLIQQTCGFAPATLTLNLRLLDDLNLDSIKAGDLLVKLAASAGVRWPEDPGQMANATLEEIIAAVDRLQTAAGGPEQAANKTGQNDTGAETLAAFADAAQRPAPWVRDFYLEKARRDLPPKAGDEHWRDARVLILHTDAEKKLPGVLEKTIEQLGGRAATRHASDQALACLEPAAAYTHCIAVMPDQPVPLNAFSRFIPEIVAQLALTAQNAGAFQKSICFVQYGGRSAARDMPPAGCGALAAGLHFEHPRLSVNVVDLPSGADERQSAAAVLNEIAAAQPYGDAFYDEQFQRWAPRPALSVPAAYTPRSIAWRPDDVILVSGGAKGITADCALAAALRVGARRLALIGRAPLPDPDKEPQNEIQQTLERMRAAGIQAAYHVCDVTDAAAVARTVAIVRARQGTIRALIHGAGVNSPRLAALVSPARALIEIGPKVNGLLNLWEALEAQPPELIAGLSSIIGVTGMPGNVWYGFANETLDRLLRAIAAASPATQTQSIAFSVWADKGMGVQMGSVDRLSRMGIDAIPAQEGAQRFARLFESDPGRAVVVVTGRLAGLDTWSWSRDDDPNPVPFVQNTVLRVPGVEAAFTTHLDLERHFYLRDHCFQGTVLFPTVFGLEAMAQAARKALGGAWRQRLRLENIRLKKPITVDPEHGADILVWARVEEPEKPHDPPTIKAGVRKIGAGGESMDYFSATLVCDGPASPDGKTAPDPLDRKDAAAWRRPLAVEPGEDLYRDTFLFQGPLYQRIEQVAFWRGDSRSQGRAGLLARHRSARTAAELAFGDANLKLLLPDPFFSDVLLQSVALLAPRDTCLPVAVDSMEIDLTALPMDALCRVRVDLLDRREKTLHARVEARTMDGRLMMRLDNYQLKIIKHNPDFPLVTDLTDPRQRDRALFTHHLRAACARLGYALPEVALASVPGIHDLHKEQRHQLEQPVLNELMAAVEKRWPGRGGTVVWNADGKPVAAAADKRPISLSLSHDHRLCLAAAGDWPQGCDLAPVRPREPSQWAALLGPAHSRHLDSLVAKGDTADQAGARLWAVIETARKALGAGQLELRVKQQWEKTVSFQADAGRSTIDVISFPIRLTWGPLRMAALTVTPVAPSRGPCLPEAVTASYRDLCAQPAYEVSQFDPDKGLLFVHRFPVSFKPGAQLGRHIYFTSFFSWMGHAREAVIYPIMSELMDLLATGRWGSVTNYSRLRIHGEARAGDIVELRMWTMKNDGPQNSTTTLGFDFICPGPGGRRLALGELQTTWVAFTGHGVAKPAPYPPFMQTLFKAIMPATDAVHEPRTDLPAPLASWHDHDDEPLYAASHGPVARPRLAARVFETSQVNSNAVGNIYYDQYHQLQGVLLDRFLYACVPARFTGAAEGGEPICLSCDVNHLREAMPFDNIQVTMELKQLHPTRAVFHFDYHGSRPGQPPLKLAWGTHTMVWVKRDTSGRPTPAPLPEPVLDAIRNAVAALDRQTLQPPPTDPPPRRSAA